uniref:Uncharacterized protein n=1 Tax=Glossina austeni TaxID=7395 RepID=A0A1A9V3K9_GLOAU
MQENPLANNPIELMCKNKIDCCKHSYIAAVVLALRRSLGIPYCQSSLQLISALAMLLLFKLILLLSFRTKLVGYQPESLKVYAAFSAIALKMFLIILQNTNNHHYFYGSESPIEWRKRTSFDMYYRCELFILISHQGSQEGHKREYNGPNSGSGGIFSGSSEENEHAANYSSDLVLLRPSGETEETLNDRKSAFDNGQGPSSSIRAAVTATSTKTATGDRGVRKKLKSTITRGVRDSKQSPLGLRP